MHPVLEFREATIRFGGLTAVAPLSFAVEAGEMLAIIGPNGAGKTTVFNLVTGVYAPSDGEIWFDGQRVASSGRALKPHRLVRLGMARTFQNIRLWGDLSVRDNVRAAFASKGGYGFWHGLLSTATMRERERLIAQRTEALLDQFSLADRAEALAVNLPYGDQRRLEIARAVATQPRLLLLDEPTSGMNPAETEELTKTIHLVHRELGITVILIEHHMSLVMTICGRVIVLDGGVKIADGPPRQIQNDPHVIAAYLGQSDPELDEAIENHHAL